MEQIEQLFALLCSRESCWAPGGEVLPFCQRCSGFYVGAAVAVVLYALFRPRPTNLSLWIHGLLLLLMVPFGYHLVPQNGVLRTLTGQLFAVGLVCFLALLPTARLSPWQREDKRMFVAYAVCVLGSLVIVQVVVHAGGRVGGAVLAWTGLVGLIALAALAVANLTLLPPAVWRVIRSARTPMAS